LGPDLVERVMRRGERRGTGRDLGSVAIHSRSRAPISSSRDRRVARADRVTNRDASERSRGLDSTRRRDRAGIVGPVWLPDAAVASIRGGATAGTSGRSRRGKDLSLAFVVRARSHGPGVPSPSPSGESAAAGRGAIFHVHGARSGSRAGVIRDRASSIQPITGLLRREPRDDLCFDDI
jgi:hypothetical protein